MADNTRLRRIAEQIKQELSAQLRDSMDDQRLAFISITHIEVVRDLSAATVYVTYIGNEDDREVLVSLLNSEASHYRYVLSQKMQLRTVPVMTFIYDKSIEYGARLQQKIKDLNSTDKDQ